MGNVIRLSWFKSGMSIKDFNAIVSKAQKTGSGFSKQAFIFDNYTVKVNHDYNDINRRNGFTLRKRITLNNASVHIIQILAEVKIWRALVRENSEYSKCLCPIRKMFYLENGFPVTIMDTAHHIRACGSIHEMVRKYSPEQDASKLYDCAAYIGKRFNMHDNDMYNNMGNFGYVPGRGVVFIDYGLTGEW